MLYTDIESVYFITQCIFEYVIYYFTIIFCILSSIFNVEPLRVSMFVNKETTYSKDSVDLPMSIANLAVSGR